MNKKEVWIQKAEDASVENLFEELSTSSEGLSKKESEKRIDVYGLNEIPEKKVNPILKFLRYFWGPIPWMIEIAIILSAVIGRWEDLYIIGALLLLNAVVGFWQENKANNAIELLKKKLALDARVLREGNWEEISASKLVPGDIIHLRLGDVVPADVKLIEGDYLSVDESALTGESLPVEKNVSGIAYSGSIIHQGEMNALVVSTGLGTYFGKTVKLVEEAETRSHLQKAVIKIGDYLIIIAAVLVTLIFIVSFIRGESFLATLQFALVLVVASIPVALPAVLSVTMAVGAIALAKKEAIVSRLVSIEEMAGTDVLCSDKTGTITKNELAVAEKITYKGYSTSKLMQIAVLSSNKESKDPIDDAILSNTESELNLDDFTVTDFKPFDPVRKRTVAHVKNKNGKTFKVTKGAPQVIASLVKDDEVKKWAEKQVNFLADKGFRSIGIAEKHDNGWKMMGLIGLHDEPREDSAKTIDMSKSMGVEVKMVTGDNISIAKEISNEVNLGSNIILPSEFVDKNIEDRGEIVEKAEGFAEVFPEHKYDIIEIMQKRGHIVAMTGDGVNDAPALKKADVGIAVAGATDAAKSAAAIVLTQPGLSVIIDTIKESRKIFQRMKNYSIYRISETIRVLFFITSSIVIFNFYPVTALMIVLLALLNDAPIMTIAYDNVIYSNKPEMWDLRTILIIATILGIIGVFSSFIVLYIGLNIFHLSREILQSFIYLKLSVAGHLMVFIARTKGPFWSVKPALPLFLAVVITQFVATIITVYGILLPAMGWNLAIFIWIYAFIAFLITDRIKLLIYRILDSGEGN